MSTEAEWKYYYNVQTLVKQCQCKRANWREECFIVSFVGVNLSQAFLISCSRASHANQRLLTACTSCKPFWNPSEQGKGRMSVLRCWIFCLNDSCDNKRSDRM